MESPNTDE